MKLRFLKLIGLFLLVFGALSLIGSSIPESKGIVNAGMALFLVLVLSRIFGFKMVIGYRRTAPIWKEAL